MYFKKTKKKQGSTESPPCFLFYQIFSFFITLFFKFIVMKTFINFLIQIIEKYEDAVYWYHINLDTWKIQIWDYELK